VIFLTKKSFDFNHDLNQRLKSARFKSANPDCNQSANSHSSKTLIEVTLLTRTKCAHTETAINQPTAIQVKR